MQTYTDKTKHAESDQINQQIKQFLNAGGTIKKHDIKERSKESELDKSTTTKVYMNLATGSIDSYDGWWYETEQGILVNGVDRGEVVEVVKDKSSGDWIEAY